MWSYVVCTLGVYGIFVFEGWDTTALALIGVDKD